MEQLRESEKCVTCCRARTLFKAALVPHQEERDPDHIYEVCISLKGFSKFLNSHVVSTTTIACTDIAVIWVT